MKGAQGSRHDQAYLVTEARPGLSDDVRYRQRRYLIMMGIRTACFLIAIIFFVNHLGWLTAIPAVGALVIPYFAVIFANGGREPTSLRRFRPYRPNSPAIYQPPNQGAGPGQQPNQGAGRPPNQSAGQ